MSCKELSELTKIKVSTLYTNKLRNQQNKASGVLSGYRVYEVEVSRKTYKEMMTCGSK
jgi:hypothetical protein